MRAIMVAIGLALALPGAALAQGYPGHQGYPGYTAPKPPKAPGASPDIRTPEPPRFPKPPKPPEYVTPPKFKPFTGQHYDPGVTSPSGVDPYAKPKKPKGGFSPYGG